MTLPTEHVRALIHAQQFLKDLLVPSFTPRVPRKIRNTAYTILRHYPFKVEIESNWMNGKWKGGSHGRHS